MHESGRGKFGSRHLPRFELVSSVALIIARDSLIFKPRIFATFFILDIGLKSGIIGAFVSSTSDLFEEYL